MSTLIAFFNDKNIKKKYIDRLKQHKKQNEIVHGVYWEDGIGCAVGCTIHSSDHSKYESEMGIPKWLPYIKDQLFEGMQGDKNFPLRLMKAIPVGTTEEQFDTVKHKFLTFCLKKIRKNIKHGTIKDAIQNIIDLHSKAAEGKYITDSEWEAASAAADVAEAAARAAKVAAWSAARAVEYKKMADRLIKLFREVERNDS